MRLAFIVIFALAATSAAAAPCTPPGPVAGYLCVHPGWRLLRVADLVEEDRALWREYHRHECPGLAVVALDASGAKSYALALVQAENPAATERFIVLLAPSFKPMMFAAPSSDGNIVLYRVPPGVEHEWDEPHRMVRIRHDSIVLERMESASQQYYLVHGRFRMIQTSD